MDTRSAVQSVGHSQWSERRYFEKNLDLQRHLTK